MEAPLRMEACTVICKPFTVSEIAVVSPLQSTRSQILGQSTNFGEENREVRKSLNIPVKMIVDVTGNLF